MTDRKSYACAVRIACRNALSRLICVGRGWHGSCLNNGSGEFTRRRYSRMKKLSYFGTVILAAGLTSIPALAQSAPTPSQDPSQQPSATQPAQSQPSQASPTSSDSTSQGQAFTGTIVKGSDGFMMVPVNAWPCD